MKHSARIQGALALALAVAGDPTTHAETPEATDRGPAQTFELWDGVPPGYVPPGPPRVLPSQPGRSDVLRITDVDRPVGDWWPAGGEGASPARTAIVVVPGGGFHILAAEHEGAEVAVWLNGLGVDALVLKYRVPTANQSPPWEPGLADVQRALQKVRDMRRHAGQAEGPVGLLGFSAGAHLCARAAMAVPTATGDATTARPELAVLIYPYRIVTEEDSQQLRPGMSPDATTPPLFLIHAADDRVSVWNTVTLFSAALAAGVPAEMHAFTTSGHGFGMRDQTPAGAAWPGLCERWLESQGFLPTP